MTNHEALLAYRLGLRQAANAGAPVVEALRQASIAVRRSRRGLDVDSTILDLALQQQPSRLAPIADAIRGSTRKRPPPKQTTYPIGPKPTGPSDTFLALERHVLVTRVVRAITSQSLRDAKAGGADQHKLNELQVSVDNAKGTCADTRKKYLEAKDQEARQNLYIPNLEQPFQSAPPIHPVMDFESCITCGKHKFPSCGPTVFASLRKASIDSTVTWLQDLNISEFKGMAMRRLKDHTIACSNRILDRAAELSGFVTLETVLDPKARFRDVVGRILKNRESATYIVSVPKHVLLLRTDGADNFELLDSGYMFKRHGTGPLSDLASIRTKRQITRLVRLLPA